MGRPSSARHRTMADDRANRLANPAKRSRVPHLTTSTRDPRSREHHRHRLQATATGVECLKEADPSSVSSPRTERRTVRALAPVQTSAILPRAVGGRRKVRPSVLRTSAAGSGGSSRRPCTAGRLRAAGSRCPQGVRPSSCFLAEPRDREAGCRTLLRFCATYSSLSTLRSWHPDSSRSATGTRINAEAVRPVPMSTNLL